MAQARLGDYTFLVNPDEVLWDFRVKTSEINTIGGKVVQVFGTDLGDMMVKGKIIPNLRGGDTEAWEEAERFMDSIAQMSEAAADDPQERPVRFSVPEMDWAFDVHIKNVAPMQYSVGKSAEDFALVLFIVEDVTGRVERGITDKYIERLARGIGWSQSEYNGPTEEEVNERLAAYQGSAGLAYKTSLIEEFVNAIGGSSAGAGGAGGGGGGFPSVAGPEGINAYLWALREQESGGDYTVVNSIGAAGAYQYMPATWNNYQGYSSAHLAPPAVQDERAGKDAAAAFEKHGTWAAAASIHYSGQYWPPDSYVWDKPQSGAPTIREYVNSVLGKMAQAPG